MIGMRGKVKLTPKELERKLHGAAITNLGHAGGAIRRVAQQSIKIIPYHPSTPGNPPHSRAGLLKKAIIYHVDRAAEDVTVGPTANVVGPAAVPHEYGGFFRGDYFPARPFMGPAFKKVQPRLAPMWANSVK